MNDEGALWVACLCAAWCRTCDGYRATLNQVVAETAAAGTMTVLWIDIEDEAALVGDVDVETFPTLLIGDALRLLFAGPVTPQPETLRRLLARLSRGEGAMPAGTVPQAIGELARRLRDRVNAPPP